MRKSKKTPWTARRRMLTRRIMTARLGDILSASSQFDQVCSVLNEANKNGGLAWIVAIQFGDAYYRWPIYKHKWRLSKLPRVLNTA